MKHNQIKNNWFEDFFNKDYLTLYSRKGIFSTKQAKKETDFVIKVLNLPKNSKILDLACGHGRHTIRLVKKGYKLTGVDLSKTLLNSAKKFAKKEKVEARFIRNDMRKISFKNEFDAVINLFSSFGYFPQEKENLKVLKVINKSLKPRGKFLLDLLNKDRFFKQLPISKLKKIWWKSRNNYILEDISFSKNKKFVNYLTIISPKGKIRNTYAFMRLYSLLEIKNELRKTGFKILKTYGDYQGNKFTLLSPRLIILAQKK